jgi:spore maturation protein CgeB
MKLVIFGLTLSSSWGNGHATLWRGLIHGLAVGGHEVVFFEHDVPYYAAHRDVTALSDGQLILYDDWGSVLPQARHHTRDADAVIVTSYCPDAITASRLIFDEGTHALRVFYDLDTPVTLARVEAGDSVDYLPSNGLRDFDLVLSYTGGAALTALQERLGAREVAPLYGHVDPEVHHPVPVNGEARSALSYLGTYAHDRQETLLRLFIEPAKLRPADRFVLGGSGYPQDFPWQPNIWFVRHIAPAGHATFFSSSRLTLNVTRADMAAMGFCPSGRLFEAAACGAPLLTDSWPGLEEFFTPGEEILVARSTEDAVAAVDSSAAMLGRIARAGRERTLAEHTSAHRAGQLIDILGGARRCGA